VRCTIINTATGETVFSTECDLSSVSVNVADANGKVTTYKPNSDGIVEGIGSEYPTMSITNSIGAEMVCEYNRDLNKTDVADTWEHIETITTTEDTKSVYVEREPDGTRYNFKKLRVIITNADGGTANAYIAPTNAQSNWTASYYLLNHKMAIADLWLEFGYLWVETHSGLGDYSQFHNAGKPIPKESIDSLRVSGNGTILAGSTFEIWGVRA
jgi:hypothetical protein